MGSWQWEQKSLVEEINGLQERMEALSEEIQANPEDERLMARYQSMQNDVAYAENRLERINRKVEAGKLR